MRTFFTALGMCLLANAVQAAEPAPIATPSVALDPVNPQFQDYLDQQKQQAPPPLDHLVLPNGQTVQQSLDEMCQHKETLSARMKANCP